MTMWSSLTSRVRGMGGSPAVLALSVPRMGDAVGNGVLMFVLPLYVAALPAPVAHVQQTLRVGLLLAAYGIVAAVGQPIAGILSDRLGRRKVLVQLGLILMAAATLAFTFAGWVLRWGSVWGRFWPDGWHRSRFTSPSPPAASSA